MGFYGNITNVNSTTFVFDRIFKNRVELENSLTSANGDGVFIGRYVLIDYSEGNLLDNYSRVYKYGTRFYWSPDASGKTHDLRVQYIDQDYYVEKEIMDFETGEINKVVEVNELRNDEQYKNFLFKGEIVYTSDLEIDSETKDTKLKITFYECVGLKETLRVYNNETGAYEDRNYADLKDITKTDKKPEIDPYFSNYAIDKTVYGDIGRGYDSTVWQKIYQDDKEKYVMIAELNSVVPTFGLTIDPPSLHPIPPHFDADTTNVYYKLHVQPSWGFRVKEALDEEGNPIPSDQKASDIEYVWDPESQSMKIYGSKEYNGDIYYNKDNFSSEYRYDKGEEIDIINFDKTGYSGRKYNTSHDNPETMGLKTEYPDILEFSFNLPSLGNTVSKMWDIVYGEGEVFEEDEKYTRYRRNKNIDWNSKIGERLVKEKTDGTGFEYDVEKVETLAGCINSVHDLMGMIISDEQNVSKDDALVNRIYYGSYDEKRPDYKGYFIKERTFEILNDKELITEPIDLKDFSQQVYYFKDNENYYLETTGYHSGNVYYPLTEDNIELKTLYKLDYEPNKYYYLKDNNYILAVEEIPYPDKDENGEKILRNYYEVEEGQEEKIINKDDNYFFPTSKDYYKKMFSSKTLEEGEDDKGMDYEIGEGLFYLEDENKFAFFSEEKVGEILYTQKLYWKTYLKTYELAGSGGYTEVILLDDNIPDNLGYEKVEKVYIMHEFKPNTYYYYDAEISPDYILLNDINEIENDRIYYSFAKDNKFFLISEMFYEPNLYYYKEGNDYILAREDRKQLNKDYYIIKTVAPTTDIFYEPNKYYYKVNGEFVVDMTPTFTEDREYYPEGVELYVYEDINNIIAKGAKWNGNIEEIPEGIALGRREEKYIWKELTGFARTLNTIHGLILKLNNLIHFNDEITRDTTTLQGCINKINDIIRSFGKLIPGQLVVVDNYGRISSSPYTSSQDVKAIRYDYDYANNELIEEPIEIEGSEEGWLGINTIADKDNLNIGFTHKYNPIDKETNEVDMNAVGDTFGIPVPVVDTAGHVVALDLINAKLPNGYKSISTGETSSIAENSKDNLIVSTDSWLSAKAENGELIFNHEYSEKQENTTSSYNVNNNGDNIEIETVVLDEKGHVKNTDTKIITLPFGYKSFTDGVNTSIAQNTQDDFMLIGDSWIKPIISQGQVELTHIGPVSNNFTEVVDVKPQFGETVNIIDLHFDSKGHKFAESSHTITIPQGSLEAPIPNGSDIINQLVFEPTTGKLTIERANISSLKLSGYEKSVTGIIEAEDTLGEALSKLQIQIENGNTANTIEFENIDNKLDKLEDNSSTVQTAITTLQDNIKDINDNFDVNVKDIVKSTEFEYTYNENTSSMTIAELMIYISSLEDRIVKLENPIVEETPQETPTE